MVIGMKNYSFVDCRLWQTAQRSSPCQIEPFEEENKDLFVCAYPNVLERVIKNSFE